jgi:hypothetical protein
MFCQSRLSRPVSTCILLAFPALGVASDLRPLSTDRPDTTESPYTVDAGHFQFEMEIANATRYRGVREFSLAELNAKIGLDAATDLQVVLPFYTRIKDGAEGFGDVEIRLKRNLWGNDEGSTALAVMPFIKLPTANGDLGNGDFEGGVMLPIAFEGPAGWSCGAMGQLDLASSEDGEGTEFVGLISATISHALTETSAVFFECVGIQSSESATDFECYFNSGATWSIALHTQLDAGIRVGLNRAATDFMPFTGISAKF